MRKHINGMADFAAFVLAIVFTCVVCWMAICGQAWQDGKADQITWITEYSKCAFPVIIVAVLLPIMTLAGKSKF